jgi:hypothetical protein
MKKKTKTISAWLPSSVMKALEDEAKKSGRTVFEELVLRVEQSLNKGKANGGPHHAVYVRR